MTEDRSAGVLLWRADPGNAGQYVVYRQDFTVAANGDLSLEPPVQLLPLEGEEVPAEDELYYHNMDIWGDATHDELYLSAHRVHRINSGPGERVEELLIYNLNDMTEVREIYRSAQAAGEWNCPPDADYPQFVPACHLIQGMRFNPSGTRLYFDGEFHDNQDQGWDGALRIHIDRIDAETGGAADLADWNFSAPELVYTGPGEPRGSLARPDYDPSQMPLQEFIAIRFGNMGALLDADQCAIDYAAFADGDTSPEPEYWQACVDPDSISELSSFLHGGGDSWESHDALLFSTPAEKGKFHFDIFRRNTSGMDAGTEQRLIEYARGADTGY
jgi:hypothetical protein